MNARPETLRTLAAAGIPAERQDEPVAALETGAIAGTRIWIAESSAPDGVGERCRGQPG
ncbi:hypothetical protein ACOZE3_32995 [Streptomyces cinereoruber]|uniref:hypothetical protein n=1 Tax=Streptomyces cinereoruber TaxID=67260 RepID=UPI003BF503A6